MIRSWHKYVKPRFKIKTLLISASVEVRCVKYNHVVKHYHVAIMKESWGLLPKILSGEKSIESRWYLNKSRPWGNINAGDVVYFKNSGEPVTVKADVDNVLFFENFNSEEIIKEYGKKICLTKAPENKKYCILIFLKNAKKVKPFEIDRTGFGSMAAWLTYTTPKLFRDHCLQDNPGEV